jgi:hypothetical protein
MIAAEEADPGTAEDRQRKLDADLAAINYRSSPEALNDPIARMHGFCSGWREPPKGEARPKWRNEAK